jgi:xanthine dehydrogenase/oxidase
MQSLYALLRNESDPSELEIEEAFDGNLCRCTGYRPILDAAQSFSAKNSCGKSSANGGKGCCMESNNGRPGVCCKGKTDSVDGEPPAKRFSPPGFIEYNPDTQLIFPPALTKHEFKPLAFGNKIKRWYRPVTLKQLLEIKSVYPSAKVIGGSTETQIEIKFKAMQYAASVFVGDIAELRQHSFEDDYLEIGGSVVLTDLEEICLKAIEHYGPVKGQPFKAIRKQIRYFAGRQIRNVGTPAGNLATASPISDLNPVFLATNSILIAKSLHKTTELPMSDFFTGYRRTALPPDAIIASIRVPIASEKGEFLRVYKQSKRKDDDIAIVNAALRVSLDEIHNVKSVDLVYGGLGIMTLSAKGALQYLAGKNWTDPATLEGTMNALESDFNLPFGVPGGMATYRKSLALGFFYKFYHEVLARLEVKAASVDADAIGEIEREMSFGKKDHDATQAYEKKILGRANPHVAALKQCTGEAQYTDDIPVQKNELYGAMVLSAKAHAKLLSVDPSPAFELPGVVEWVDHNDLPNPQANWWGAPNCDEVFFAVDEVFTAGQPIGMILARSAKEAEAAARAVKIKYEDLPAIFTIEEAIAKESYFDHHRFIKKGNPAKAFEEADHIFSGTVRMGGQEHFYLETQAALAIPKPEDGEMEIWSSTQNPTET